MSGERYKREECRDTAERDTYPPYAKPFCGLAGFDSLEVLSQFVSSQITLRRLMRAGLQQDLVELQQLLLVGARLEIAADLWKIEPVFPHRDFVKYFAQAINVGLRGAGSFRRNVTFGADE